MRSAIAAMSGIVPIKFDAAVTATSRVRPESCASMFSTGNSLVCGSKSTHRTVAPVFAAAITHGRMLAS